MTFFVFSVLPAPDSPLQQVSRSSCHPCANSRHEDALVGALFDQIPERMVGHGEDVWLGLLSAAPPVHVDVFSRVDRQRAVRVDGDQKQAGVGLDGISSAPRPGGRSHVHISDPPGTAYGGCGSPRARSGA
jgi:hypothetical protein